MADFYSKGKYPACIGSAIRPPEAFVVFFETWCGGAKPSSVLPHRSHPADEVFVAVHVDAASCRVALAGKTFKNVDATPSSRSVESGLANATRQDAASTLLCPADGL